MVLIGHGSTVNANSAETVRTHAEALRASGIFGEVREIFWKETADFSAAAKAGSARRVFLVPMFISEGYFSEEKIPRALGYRPEPNQKWERTIEKGGRKFVYCKPIGTHPAMTSVIVARANEVLERFPFPRRPKKTEVSLFIAGHGTEQNPMSRRSIDAQVEIIRNGGAFGQVEAVFIEEDPLVSQSAAMSKMRNIVVVPFFMAEGAHVAEDLPRMLGAPERIVKERLAKGQSAWRNPTERDDKRIWLAESAGTDPKIADVVLARIKEAAM